MLVQEAQAHAARVEADNEKSVIEAERIAVEQANFQKVRARAFVFLLSMQLCRIFYPKFSVWSASIVSSC